MRLTFVLALLLLLFGVAHDGATASSSTQSPPVYVAAGMGVDGITVGHSTKSSVISKYGDGYQLIEHNKYSYEINYDNYGLSFWYRYGDAEEKIFAIAAKPKSRGFTGRGIVVGRSTLKDVFDAYGKSKFYSTSAEETWFAEYQGIAFHVEYKRSDNDQHFNQEKLLQRKIVEIEVVEIGSEIGSPGFVGGE